jgi:hypothetical protein
MRSALRDEAAFVSTNPPFSLFRQFMMWSSRHWSGEALALAPAIYFSLRLTYVVSPTGSVKS